MKRASRVPIVVALAVSVVGAGVARSLVAKQRRDLDASRHEKTDTKADLSKVNSFALGLLLGGLRGPLVMALWTSSENQKTERDLEDFDTKVELIRLLQPEFDTVHLFQIWNKAYNVSVQMANVPNKYTTILDALAYAFNVDQERPDNINILESIAGLYFNKFGEASEKIYFRSRLESETMPTVDRVHVTFDAADRERAVRQARLSGASAFQLGVFDANEQGTRQFLNLPAPMAEALRARFDGGSIKYETITVRTDARRDSSGRPLQHESLLDAQYRIKPEYTQARPGQPDVPTNESGARLPYLAAFGPFPQGVSPYALAYNYYKRADWLQVNRNAHHAQVNERVIASRGAKSLEKWSEEEWQNAVRAEIDLAGLATPATEQLMSATAGLTLQADLPQCPLFDQALAGYERASAIARQSIDEYEKHIQAYGEDEVNYRSQIRDLVARADLTTGDALFLSASRASGDERRRLAADGSAAYLRAANRYTRLVIRYYVDESEADKVFPKDLRGKLTRTDADDNAGRPAKIRDDELEPIMRKVRALHAAAGYQLGTSTDVQEIDTLIQRAYARKRALDLVQ